MNIRVMTADDIPFAMRLKAQNNWNQLEADWRRQLELEPTGCFVAEVNGQPLGTACACVFDDVAWINLVLVDMAQRGQGVGTALMKHVLQYLDEAGVPCIRLDATSLGEPVYRKLGFVDEFTLHRYGGVLAGRAGDGEPATPSLARPANESDLTSILELDQAVTKTSRNKLLRYLYQLDPSNTRVVNRNGRLEGYCFIRRGSNAWQLGPLQGTPEACAALLRDAATRFVGWHAYLDVPVDNAVAIAAVQALGLTVQRSLLRMNRGRRLREDLDRFWTSFSPEKG